MSFAWQAYLTVAEALIRARNTFAPPEARYRAAISRAYYAAYGAARNHARDYEGYVPVLAGRDHSLVAAHYQAGASRTHHKIDQILQRLIYDRHRADYADHIDGNLRTMAQVDVQEARQVFALLQQLRS
jgi:hypothetical protein